MSETFQIVRESETSDPMIGKLHAGDISIYTLELPWFDNIRDASCIPAGTYQVVIAQSHRFKRLMPRLVGVPDRDSILIHPGNTKADTEGCILVGTERRGAGLLYSRLAFSRFFVWLSEAMRDGPVEVEISYAA